MVPVVDVSSPSAAPDLAAALTDASCAWLVGHGVPLEQMHAVYDTARQFFALPVEEKRLVEWPGTGLWRGWQPVVEGGDSYGGAARPTELLERFEVNLTEPAGGPDNADNRWPSRPAALRPVWQAYSDAMLSLSSRVLTLLAGELGLPAEELPAWTERQFSNLVVNHYLPQPSAPGEGRTRVIGHTDHGGVTLLWFDDAPGGLQVRRDKEWVDVRARPGALLLQAGDLLERWTGGRVHAHHHRVVNPPPGPGNGRQSVVWFHHPEPTAEVAGVRVDEFVYGRQLAYRAGEV